MDDRFLQDQRRDPDPEFAHGLRARLRRLEDEAPPRGASRRAPLLAAAAVLVAVGALFAFPGLRAQAQAMLDLFRVREFAVVQVDEARIQALRNSKLDLRSMLTGASMQPQGDATVRMFPTLAAASAAAGFTPERAEILPRGLVADTVYVHGGTHTQATIDTRPLRQAMEAFDVRDLEIPAGVDGGALSIDVPTVMAQTFRNPGKARAVLVQCASPEVSLPKGVDLNRLGEIGLRLVGIEPGEAHRLAGAIDWRSTLVLPVIASATTFQQVDVRGEHGVYVETSRFETPDGPHSGPGCAVLWTRQGRVYALAGNLDRVSALQMAESVR